MRLRLSWIAAVVPLLLAAVLPSHIAKITCRFTGATMPLETCCPEGGNAAFDPQARLRDESCCASTTVDLPSLVSEFRSDAVPLAAYTDVAAGLAIAIPRPSGRPSSLRYIAPLPARPPPIALKSSLLI